MTTIRDIAKRLNINPSTVSRAFSNPDLVSEDTRARILEIAREMNYSPNRIARQLRQSRSNVLGLIVDEEDWSWYSDRIVTGVQHAANQLGYNVLIWNAHGDDGQRDGLMFFAEMRFAGAVVAHTQVLERKPDNMQGFPVVYVNQDNQNVPSIYPDEEQGTLALLQHLYDHGHRDIAYIRGPDGSYHAQMRYKSFCRFMRRHRLPLRDEWVRQGSWQRDSGYRAAKAILCQPHRPSAIVSSNDVMAVGVYDAAREAGIAIPTQLSVVGYDDQELCQWVTPKLTTFTLPLWEMCGEAVQMLDRLIHEERKTMDDSVYVTGHLLCRDSVAAPPM